MRPRAASMSSCERTLADIHHLGRSANLAAGRRGSGNQTVISSMLRVYSNPLRFSAASSCTSIPSLTDDAASDVPILLFRAFVMPFERQRPDITVDAGGARGWLSSVASKRQRSSTARRSAVSCDAGDRMTGRCPAADRLQWTSPEDDNRARRPKFQQWRNTWRSCPRTMQLVVLAQWVKCKRDLAAFVATGGVLIGVDFVATRPKQACGRCL